MSSSTPTTPVSEASSSAPESPLPRRPLKSARPRPVPNTHKVSAPTPDSNAAKSKNDITLSELHNPLMVYVHHISVSHFNTANNTQPLPRPIRACS